MASPIIVELGAGIQQHVADPRHRDEIADAIGALRQRSKRDGINIMADIVGDGIAKSDAASGCADLPKHGGKRNRGPVGLLAILLPGQGPADRHHGAFRRHPSRQIDNLACRHGCQPAGPLCILADPVGCAIEIGGEFVIPNSIAREEPRIRQTFGTQCLAQCQDQRGVAVGAKVHGARRCRRFKVKPAR